MEDTVTDAPMKIKVRPYIFKWRYNPETHHIDYVNEHGICVTEGGARISFNQPEAATVGAALVKISWLERRPVPDENPGYHVDVEGIWVGIASNFILVLSDGKTHSADEFMKLPSVIVKRDASTFGLTLLRARLLGQMLATYGKSGDFETILTQFGTQIDQNAEE